MSGYRIMDFGEFREILDNPEDYSFRQQEKALKQEEIWFDAMVEIEQQRKLEGGKGNE